MSERLVDKAFALHRSGRLDDAERLYRGVLTADPNQLDALYLLGFLQYQRGAYPEALALYGRALERKPDFFDALAARAIALSSLERHADALLDYDRAVALRRDHVQSWSNRGNALLALGRAIEAVASYDRALSLQPDYADAWRNRGIALVQLERLDEALASFDEALARHAGSADLLEHRAALLTRLGRREEAIATYDRAIALKPGNPDLLYNRGNAHAILGHYEDAVRDCAAALALDPDYPYARGVLVHSKLQACDWHGLDEETQKISAAITAGKRVISPFNLKALSDSPAEHRRCAELWVAHQCPPSATPLAGGAQYRHDRIRLAYVSSDFNNTAVAAAIAGVFEHHDKSRFETIAVSFGPSNATLMRTRLQSAFDRFIDVRDRSDADIAALIRAMDVDIAVDLMGFTGECRSTILAARPAPVQVNYLGFPGTMGAPYIDYILADRVVIPQSQQNFYAENVVVLPQCFLPTDSSRGSAKRKPNRAEAGLPEAGFVFASFNNTYKFSPSMFGIWMRLLGAIDGSVLWLPQGNALARRNLAREAEARGIAPQRIVFAPPVPAVEDHLARLSLADLFLDTHPYNAHSTAIDAVLAGVPVLTMLGNSFASRVAASVLTTAGLPELIADSPAAYEAAALRLAREPESLAALKAKPVATRAASPLFDTPRFTRALESAFATMAARHKSGLAPASFAVESPG